MTERPTLLVVTGPGAASKLDVQMSLAATTDLVFVDGNSLGHPSDRRTLAETMSPQGVTTFSETHLEVTAELASLFALPFHSRETASALRRKDEQRAALGAAGVESIRYRVVEYPSQWEQAERDVGLPLVLKPLSGQGSRNTFRVTTSRQGRELCERLISDGHESSLIAEELLVGRDSSPYGDYVSVESVVSRGEIQHLPVTGKLPLVEPFRETGQFWPSVLSAADMDLVQRLTSRALRALGVTTGVTHTEIKLTNDGPRIIEVNGRLGGFIGDLALRGVQVDLVAAAGNVALGRPVEVSQQVRPGVFFNFTPVVPPDASRLVTIHGSAEATRVQAILRHRFLTAPGSDLPIGVATCDVDLLTGHAQTHEEMLAALREAMSLLSYELEAQNGDDLVLGGGELPSRVALGA